MVLFSQENEGKSNIPVIDSVMAFSPAYMPVDFAFTDPLFLIPLKYKPVDTMLIDAHHFDPLFSTENLYQSLGISGQAHQAIPFDFEREVGFTYLQLPYPLYFKKQKDLALYKLKTSYTSINYTYGIPTEHIFKATHAQNVKGLNVAFNLTGSMNEGYYAHQKIGNINGDILLHYELPSKIYGIRLSYIYNRFKIEENGGLVDMNDFTNQISANLQGYNMNLYYAGTKINAHDLMLQHYVNLYANSKKNAGKKSFYLGTITHTFQFKQLEVNYTDIQPDSNYYQDRFFLSPDTTNDSLRYYNIINTIQWSSYQPYTELSSKKYFIHFSGGLRHEYTETKPRQYFGNTFTLFAQTHIRLFSIMDIYARLAYTFADYNKNDAQANIKMEWALNRKKEHFVGLNANFYRISPDYLYSYYQGNHNQWDTTYKKQNVLKLSAFWKRGNYKATFNYFLLNNYMLLDSTCTPFAIDEYVNVVQLNLYAPIRIKGFGMDLNGWLQYSDNKLIPVPVFAGKTSVFYIFNLFKHKLQLQIGTDMMYNTTYFANGYFPALHQFYFQQKVKTGNYFFFDAFLNIRVQRINIYFRFGHALAGLMGYNYYTTPDYPMQGRSYSIGINWRFYD